MLLIPSLHSQMRTFLLDASQGSLLSSRWLARVTRDNLTILTLKFAVVEACELNGPLEGTQ